MLTGKHDGVSSTPNVFGDFHKTTPVVFLEVEEEDLAFRNDLFRMDRALMAFVLLVVVIAVSKHR